MHPKHLINPQTLLINLVERKGREISALLASLPPAAFAAEDSETSFFTLPQQVVHLTQVIGFAIQVMRHAIFGEDLPLPNLLERLTAMSPEEAHAELSTANLFGVHQGMQKIGNWDELRRLWIRSVAEALVQIASLDPEHFSVEVWHPMTREIGGTLFDFWREMLPAHMGHHYAQMVLQARKLNYKVPSPLHATEPVRQEEMIAV